MSRYFFLAALCSAAIWPFSATAVDCARATEPHIKLICSNPELTHADASINRIYQAAMVHAEEAEILRNEQRRWIQGVQSKCDSVACLATAYATRKQALLGSLSRWCGAQAAEFSGSWKRKGNEGFFEKFSAEPDGTFNSWIHQRPEFWNGAWSMDGCSIKLRNHDGSLSVDWLLIDIDRSTLKVLEDDSSGLAIYRKIEP